MDANVTRFAEIRADDDGNAVIGTAVTYGEISVANETGLPERFEAGSIMTLQPILNLVHDYQRPLARQGEGLELNDSAAALRFRAALPSTPVGIEARALLKANLLRGASIEFHAIEERLEDGVRVISRALMTGLSLVPRPAYPSSRLEMRAAGAPDAEFPADLEYRADDGLIGFIACGEAGIVSLAHKRKLELPCDADDDAWLLFAAEVMLLDGYDYGRPLATSLAGTLEIRKVKGGIAFYAPDAGLALSPYWDEVRQKLVMGAIKGAVPGVQPVESDTYTDADGYAVTRLSKATLCEIYLTVRTGKGYAGKVMHSNWFNPARGVNPPKYNGPIIYAPSMTQQSPAIRKRSFAAWH